MRLARIRILADTTVSLRCSRGFVPPLCSPLLFWRGLRLNPGFLNSRARWRRPHPLLSLNHSIVVWRVWLRRRRGGGGNCTRIVLRGALVGAGGFRWVPKTSSEFSDSVLSLGRRHGHCPLPASGSSYGRSFCRCLFRHITPLRVKHHHPFWETTANALGEQILIHEPERT